MTEIRVAGTGWLDFAGQSTREEVIILRSLEIAQGFPEALTEY